MDPALAIYCIVCGCVMMVAALTKGRIFGVRDASEATSSRGPHTGFFVVIGGLLLFVGLRFLLSRR
jgi:hypothetical protein